NPLNMPWVAAYGINVRRGILFVSRRMPGGTRWKQERFQPLIQGAARWSYEMANCSLTIGSVRFPMTPIGTFSPKHQSWLWAWANEDFPRLRMFSRHDRREGSWVRIAGRTIVVRETTVPR